MKNGLLQMFVYIPIIIKISLKYFLKRSGEMLKLVGRPKKLAPGKKTEMTLLHQITYLIYSIRLLPTNI